MPGPELVKTADTGNIGVGGQQIGGDPGGEFYAGFVIVPAHYPDAGVLFSTSSRPRKPSSMLVRPRMPM